MSNIKISSWDRVLNARKLERPKSLDYINNIFNDFIELHGDRLFGDDKSTNGGMKQCLICCINYIF